MKSQITRSAITLEEEFDWKKVLYEKYDKWVISQADNVSKRKEKNHRWRAVSE